MKILKHCACYATLIGLAAANGAYAQIGSINSVVVTERLYNDVPGATVNAINNYPGFIAISEANVSQATGFANRAAWQFSNNGTTPYAIQNGQYFRASMDLTLNGNPITPRKEAGFLFSSASSGDIQFIVNTDGHEVVQFGGISFYSFNANNGITYNSGQQITLGMAYFQDGSGNNALQFSANGVESPVFEFGPSVGSGALDIGDGSTLGGYFQIVNDPANPSNGGDVLFANISIVPEPSSFALLALGLLPLVFRRRR